MKQALTIVQMEKKFDSEWVLVENPVTDDSLDVQSGTVLCHSKDRDEVYRQAVKLQLKRFAMLYVGKLSKDVAVVL